METSLMSGWSPVRSITVRIFIVVTGHTVSQRVKMKLTIETWPERPVRVNGAPV
jgi:hypothetical protein